MSGLLKGFLREDPRRLGVPGPRALFLGAFGKHPGWDDHIEEDARTPDLGLRTASLVGLKTLLYMQGIGHCLDSGAWDRLEPAQRLDGFDHLLVAHTADQFLLGRLWSSSDGKGRTRYPMGVACHAFRTPLAEGLARLLPHLDRLHAECLAATSAAAVVAALDRTRHQLRSELDAADAPAPPEDRMARFIAHPDFGPGGEGLLRVLYQLRQQCAAFAPGHYNPSAGPTRLRAQDLRVPAAGPDAAAVFIAWSRLVRTQVDAAAPVLMLWPIGMPWLDLLLGEPTPEQWFCLRATPAKLPRVSEVPFTIEAPFRDEAQAIVNALAQDQPLPVTANPVARFLSGLFRSR
jgi:hypothetical protein